MSNHDAHNIFEKIIFECTYYNRYNAVFEEKKVEIEY